MGKKSVSKASEYAAVICAALELHGPCAPLVPKVADVLKEVHLLGVRTPTDFQFHFSGHVELRWHDGKPESFHSSKKAVSLNISATELGIRGNVTPREFSGDKGMVDIRGLQLKQAMQILTVLISLVDSAAP